MLPIKERASKAAWQLLRDVESGKVQMVGQGPRCIACCPDHATVVYRVRKQGHARTCIRVVLVVCSGRILHVRHVTARPHLSISGADMKTLGEKANEEYPTRLRRRAWDRHREHCIGREDGTPCARYGPEGRYTAPAGPSAKPVKPSKKRRLPRRPEKI